MSSNGIEGCAVLDLGGVVASSGVGYDDRVVALSGSLVIIEGDLQRGEGGVMRLGAGGAGCAHAQPQATVTLPEASLALDLVVSGAWVRLLGVLEYGLEVDKYGTATYLRLRNARPC